MTYTYDSWGNLTEKNVYAYTTATDPGTPTSTITYGYSTGSWKDQLVSYDGQSIVYDTMGNPTTYRGKTLTWRGKQLTGITAGMDVISYTYDENGLRLQKTVNNVATDYYYNGSVLIGLTKGNDTLRFSYDAAGNAAAVDHNGTYYYYLRNGQGDIVKLIDGSGTSVVEYTYDSWGKPLSCTGTLATTLGALNPFRYRGYVYDEETQWYYLRSRYYDPETCRFVFADVLLSTGQGVIGHNCYAYCGGNPITRMDYYGSCWEEIWEWLKNLFGGGNNDVANTPPTKIIVVPTAIPTATPTPMRKPSPADIVINQAAYYAEIKTPYEGAGGKDCSSFVQCVITETGIDPSFPDGARYQYDHVRKNGLWTFVETSNPSIIPRGAIVFYSAPTCNCGYNREVHHVAISCGDGTMYDSTKVTKDDILVINGVSCRSIYSVLTHTCKEESRCGVDRPEADMVIIGYAYPSAW